MWLLLLVFWHAPLAVRSSIHRHQPAPRTVLGQVDCFIQCEVVGSQITLDGVQPRDTRTPWWSLPVSGGGAVRITLASASSFIRAIRPNMESCRDWNYCYEARLLSYPSHHITANKFMPFDSKHRSEAPLIKKFDSISHDKLWVT